ncbi:hypothetical protein DL767_004281 [Monosporascus sp. MG133]|nr:hypothetical protein DL767_004281 [Monosporascus sp. MG133]
MGSKPRDSRITKALGCVMESQDVAAVSVKHRTSRRRPYDVELAVWEDMRHGKPDVDSRATTPDFMAVRVCEANAKKRVSIWFLDGPLQAGQIDREAGKVPAQFTSDIRLHGKRCPQSTEHALMRSPISLKKGEETFCARNYTMNAPML